MKKIIAVTLTFAPIVAFAQNKINDVNELSNRAVQIGNLFTGLLISLAVIFIIWNVVMYLIKSGDEEARSKAGKSILSGIVGLFIILSIWGLVNILTNSFSTTNTVQEVRLAPPKPVTI